MNDLTLSVEAWRTSADAVLDLTADLTEEEQARPTDCPGWRVRDVLAHVAHIETDLADGPFPGAGEDWSGGAPPSYTEDGVRARADVPVDRLREELRRAVEVNAARLDPLPDDPAAPADGAGGAAWDVATLRRNRAIDLWVHEQDLRRALDRPGGTDSPGARHVVGFFVAALGFVLGKRVAPPAGTVLAVEVTGGVPVTVRLRVDDDGRARPTDETPATTTLRTDTATFAMLGAGRRDPSTLPVTVEGDADLGHAVLAAMSVTP